MVSNDVSSKSCIFILRTQEMVSCQCEYLFQESSHCKSTIKVMIVKRKGRQLYEIPFFLYE